MSNNIFILPIGGGGEEIEKLSLNVSENGNYKAAEGTAYTEVNVNVPAVDVSVVSKVNSVTVLGYTSLQANIYVGSNKAISSCGVEVSTDVNFSEVSTVTAGSNTNGDKAIQISGLTPGTTYYIRSYVIVNDVNYNQEPYNTSTTAMTPVVPESIPATATKMVTANTDTVNLKFKNNSPTETVYIDWGDGAENGTTIAASTSYGSSGTVLSHTYSEAGVYDVYIWSESSTDTTYGKMPAFYANNSDMKIARIETPLQNIYNGSSKVTANTSNALQYAFYGCTSLEYVCPTLLENVHYYSSGVCRVASSCYSGMFRGCSALTNAPELPATTLASDCYTNMFNGCTSLTNAPELPATTLAAGCYYYMFYGCTALTVAPELPATTLENFCYGYMFQGCTSLTNAPELPATTLAMYCYQYMFRDCTSLTVAPDLPATTLAQYCYNYMFNGCTSLTNAPELPATTLANNCYIYMFNGCTSLTNAPELPATTLANNCYGYMFQGCTSLTNAPELPATTLVNYCYQSMFSGCTSLTNAPELHATTLAQYCYNYMFNGCKSLTNAPELPATTLANNCYQSMFNGCSNLQSVTTYVTEWNTSYTSSWLSGAGKNAENPTVYCPADSTIPSNNVDGIPTGWTRADLPTE